MPTYKVIISLILMMYISQSLYSQDIKIQTTKRNVSTVINDGEITINASGGTAPYRYFWNNKNTAIDSNVARNLTEGIDYSVIVTDATGRSVTIVAQVPKQSITEYFNSFFAPLVDKIGAVLFWDPFTLFNSYDNKIYVDEEKVRIPSWTPTGKHVYRLDKWLVSEGSHVDVGTPIALVSDNGQSPDTIRSPHAGTLVMKYSEGEEIYDSDVRKDVITKKHPKIAIVQYDDKILKTNPNGTPVTRNIPFIVIWLAFGALFFTLRLKFINIRGIKYALALARGKYDDPNAPGHVTHFQALTTAVSGTVGLGNIAGVAVAISIGGAGATLWMIIAGLLGMSSKFVECTLGVKYREIEKDGRVFGGPMNYLKNGLKRQGRGKLGALLAFTFAVLCVLASFGGGNMFQSNQSFEALSGQFPSVVKDGFWFGVIVAILVGIVIIGGIKSIANVTSKLVPFMAIIYFIGCMIVIGMNINYLGEAFSAIFQGAMSASALKGGVIGVMIVGFQRAAFSNEAGVGSAAIAHSVAKTHYPPSEGFVSLLEPFIDTVVVCTLTALVIVFTGMHDVDVVSGAQLTNDAFATVIGWFPYVLSLAIFLFAFSTMISWSYYGMRAWTYLFGRSKKQEMIYKIVFLMMVVVGSSVSLGAVLDFSDMMILAMAFPNIIGLYYMIGEVSRDEQDYRRRFKDGTLYAKKS